MTRKFWNEEEVQKLREFSKAGSQGRIGLCKELGRGWNSIQSKMNALKIPIPTLRPEVDLSEIKGVVAIDEQTQKLLVRYEAQIKDLTARKKIVVHNFYDRERRVGIVSDTQLGSLYE